MSFRLFRRRTPQRAFSQPFVWLPRDTPLTGIAREIAACACQTSDPFTRATLNELAPKVARLEISIAALTANPIREQAGRELADREEAEPVGVVL